MENQVLSIEQMQELVELGIDISNASMCWGKWDDVKEYSLFAENKTDRESFIQDLINNNCVDEEDAQEYAHNTIPTFTLQDILEILPDSIRFKKHKIGIYHLEIIPLDKRIGGVLFLYKSDTDRTTAIKFDGSYIEAAFNMLKWCKQKNYI